MLYDVKNIELVWRGLTLSKFAGSKVKISQNGDAVKTYTGIFGETMTIPNHSRFWNISSSFLANSESYKILEQDSLYHTSGTLIVRDLNSGTSDTFTDCYISLLENKQDCKERTVVWFASKRNYK